MIDNADPLPVIRIQDGLRDLILKNMLNLIRRRVPGLTIIDNDILTTLFNSCYIIF